jgi:RNA polymerase sigma-70 factor (ECF subfamily)
MEAPVSETLLIEQLTAQNERVFETIFKRYYKPLFAYACTIVKEELAADNMVQNVFYKIWKGAERINIQSSIAAYLYRAVYNESINYVKHEKVKQEHRKETDTLVNAEANTAVGKLLHTEL